MYSKFHPVADSENSQLFPAVVDSNSYFEIQTVVALDNYEVIARQGEEVKISVSNIQYAVEPLNTGIAKQQLFSMDSIMLFYVDTTGYKTRMNTTKLSYQLNGNIGSGVYTAEFTAPADLQKVIFTCNYKPKREFGITGSQALMFYWQNNATSSPAPLVKVSTEEAGLLKGLLGKVQAIFDSIADLPNKLWSAIENGLKSLFVPSEEYMVQFKEKTDLLLEEKLGAVYQVVDITLNSWDSIKTADEQNTISFPQTTISVGSNENFSFGGYDVQIVPNGFEGIASTLKVVVGIVCTILFVNGLRKRYDEIMGVEQ